VVSTCSCQQCCLSALTCWHSACCRAATVSVGCLQHVDCTLGNVCRWLQSENMILVSALAVQDALQVRSRVVYTTYMLKSPRCSPC
jgi:hypothetical protein